MPLPSKQGAQNFQRKIVAKTASYQVTAEESGTLFTTRGATAAVTFTLPAVTNLVPGTYYDFYSVTNVGMVIASSGSSDNITSMNDLSADSITCTTDSRAIGAAVSVIWDGTRWLAKQDSVGNTYTVA